MFRKEVPKEEDAQVRIAVGIVVVVDIETVAIEVAGVDVIAVGIFARSHRLSPELELYYPIWIYALLFLNFIREQS